MVLGKPDEIPSFCISDPCLLALSGLKRKQFCVRNQKAHSKGLFPYLECLYLILSRLPSGPTLSPAPDQQPELHEQDKGAHEIEMLDDWLRGCAGRLSAAPDPAAVIGKSGSRARLLGCISSQRSPNLVGRLIQGPERSPGVRKSKSERLSVLQETWVSPSLHPLCSRTQTAFLQSVFDGRRSSCLPNGYEHAVQTDELGSAL